MEQLQEAMNMNAWLSTTISLEQYLSNNSELFEYLLVANPDADTEQRVMEEKKNFHEIYQQKIAIKTKPHITVANFLATESMEETLGKWIQRICSDQQGFSVSLNNFSSFYPHTLYLRVQNQEPFQTLARQLHVIDSYVKHYGLPAAKLISKPHMSIARKLPEEIYRKAVFDYSQREFTASFAVHELVLLRRKGQFDVCKKVNVFRFQPGLRPSSYTAQLSIF